MSEVTEMFPVSVPGCSVFFLCALAGFHYLGHCLVTDHSSEHFKTVLNALVFGATEDRYLFLKNESDVSHCLTHWTNLIIALSPE